MSDKKRKRANLFQSDIKLLLYAFGDVSEPLPETVNALEDILSNYIIDLCHEAARFAKINNRQKIKVEDFKFSIRNDHIKLGRIESLINLQKIISDARKGFDDSEGKNFKKVDKEEKMNQKEKKGKKKSKKMQKLEELRKSQEEELDEDDDLMNNED